MKTHYLIIWREEHETIGVGSRLPDRLIVGSVYVNGNPRNTHDFQHLTTLGNIYGFVTYVKTAEAYLDDTLVDQRITYEQVHKDIWTRLGKRKILLAKRRKSHG